MMRRQQYSTSAPLYCGTSNIVLPVPNKAHFPPEYRDSSRLQYYASIFNSLEVNSSFYKIPMGRTIERWCAEVPEGFTFTFKLWKGITHARELMYEPEDVQRFMEVIQHAGDKKGCLLVQLPASIKASLSNRLKRLLDDITNTGLAEGWRPAVEFRDRSWYTDKTYQLLEQYKACVVIHDMPRSATPDIDMEASFAYLRFHGERGDYRGSYTHEQLKEQAERINELRKEGKTVFAYFNNTLGEAVHNAMDLATMIK